MSSSEPTFQCAFVALSYVLGQRGAGLLSALTTPRPEARRLAQRLLHPERERRAEILAGDLSRVVLALNARSLR